MSKRKSLSKKIRFEIFKRDSFACQYCDKSPPSIILEIDHITPVSKGGENDPDNLITACFDCNRGKLNHLEFGDLCEYMDLACEKQVKNAAFKYFCGICWNRIKGRAYG